jgi:plastocyanin
MRRLVYLVAIALALALPANVLAATKVINIYGTTMQPRSVTIQTGDAVRWVNRDNANHQIVADRGTFASPILRQGQTYTFTFRAAGTFGFRDVVGKAGRGTVRVQGPPPSVTLGTGSPILVFGSTTTLTGTVSNGQASETVTISAQPFGQTSTQQVATVTTGTGGGFSYTVNPTVYTSYVAAWKGSKSQTVAVQVRPKLTFLPLEGRMYAKVVGPSQAYAGHFVYLQRLTRFGWIAVGRYKLGPLSGRIFNLPRRCGTSTYRVYLSVDQAGTGFLDSWSGTQKKRYTKRCKR